MNEWGREAEANIYVCVCFRVESESKKSDHESLMEHYKKAYAHQESINHSPPVDVCGEGEGGCHLGTDQDLGPMMVGILAC